MPKMLDPGKNLEPTPNGLNHPCCRQAQQGLAPIGPREFWAPQKGTSPVYVVPPWEGESEERHIPHGSHGSMNETQRSEKRDPDCKIGGGRLMLRPSHRHVPEETPSNKEQEKSCHASNSFIRGNMDYIMWGVGINLRFIKKENWLIRP